MKIIRDFVCFCLGFALMTAVCVQADPGILEDLNTAWDTKTEHELVFEARAQLQRATRQLLEALDEFARIKTLSNFDTVSQDVKATLLAWETILKAAKASMLANSDIVDCYEWTP